jgi:hypothetical protein
MPTHASSDAGVIRSRACLGGKVRVCCRHLDDPDTWIEVRGEMEPSPFDDLFWEPEDIFGGEVWAALSPGGASV